MFIFTWTRRFSASVKGASKSYWTLPCAAFATAAVPAGSGSPTKATERHARQVARVTPSGSVTVTTSGSEGCSPT